MKRFILHTLSLALLTVACAPVPFSGRVSAAAPENQSGLWGITPLPVVETPGAKDQPQLANLVPEENNTCFNGGCHASMLMEAGQYLHKPFEEGFCDPCHQMAADHDVNNAPHVASQQDIDLCFDCHENDALGRSHPVDEDRMDPMTGELFTCTSTCHDPHSAPFPTILRYQAGGTLCVLCHKEFN